MSKRQLKLLSYLIATICVLNFISCSKSNSSGGSVTPPTNPSCNTFVITPTATSAEPCGGSGSIQVTATGSNGFMYKLNSGGTFQQSGSFANLATGNYTVFVKDSAGCQQSVSVTVSATAPGPLFANVKSLIAARCESCHNNGNSQGGMNWDNQCNIINNRVDIQGQVSTDAMPYGGPALSASDKMIITNWINAGGGYSN